MHVLFARAIKSAVDLRTRKRELVFDVCYVYTSYIFRNSKVRSEREMTFKVGKNRIREGEKTITR